MKRFTCLFMCLIVVLSATCALSSSARVVRYGFLGDVMNDGEVDALDVTALLRYNVGMDTSNLIESEKVVMQLGDVDGDHTVSVIDATLIQRYIVGIKPHGLCRIGEPVILDMILDEQPIDSMTNAHLCYDTFKAYGLDDVHIAGLLAVLDISSRISPNAIEGSYISSVSGKTDGMVDNYAFDPYMKQLLYNGYDAQLSNLDKEALDAYCERLFDSYGFSVYERAYSYNDENDVAHYCPGIGLLGWTGTSGIKLMKFADTCGNHRHWYDLDVQLEAIIRGIGLSNSLEGYKNLELTDVRDAAVCAHASLVYGYSWGTHRVPFAGDMLNEKADEWYVQCREWSNETGISHNHFGEAVVWSATH